MAGSAAVGLRFHLLQNRPNRVERDPKGRKTLDLRFLTEREHDPLVPSRRRMDEVCRSLIGLRHDDDPTIMRRIVASTIADIGRGNIACIREPLVDERMLIRR